MDRFRCIQIRPVLVLLLCTGLVGILVNCGGDGAEGDAEWTVRDGVLMLERDLLVGDDEDFYFGRIGDVGVDEDGRIYVADGEENHVKVLSPDGALATTIGEEGQGPGEFRMPRVLTLARGDSLYVYDVRSRLSVFAPDTHAFEHAVQVEVPPKRGFFSMHVPEEGGELLMAFHPWWGTEGMIGLYRVGYDGVPADSPLVTMPPEEWVARMKGGVPGPASRIPFGRRPSIALGPGGQIYQGYSDSLAVNVYSLDGTWQARWQLPYDPVPVPDSTIEARLESAGDVIRPLLQEAGIPDTKPAFDYFLTDDRGRVWFKRPTADPDRAAWWVADPEAKRVVTATLPSEVELMAVKAGRAYGRTTTEEGAPVVVRYRVRIAK